MQKFKRTLIVFTVFGLSLFLIPTGSILAADSKPAGAPTAGYSMDIADYAGQWVYQEDSKSYALNGVVYCSNPVNITLESMNIYVPAMYMNAEGGLTDRVYKGYTAETAPIIYANGVGGYSEAAPEALSPNGRSYSNFSAYLNKGYVVVSVGARGKQTRADDGAYAGKSPAGLVDLKAGVRFLRYNDKVLAGDSEKIVSVGVSAGGAMSSLLGSTGNATDYEPYLEKIGAVMTVSDDVYGAMCYCPIIDLENADMAYEWMYEGNNGYSFMGKSGTLTPFQQALSADLAAEFPAYIDGLGLDPDRDGTPLSLGTSKDGSYYDYLMAEIGEALADYLTRNFSRTSGGTPGYTGIDTEAAEKFIAGLNSGAETPWVSVSYDEKSVTTGPNQLSRYKVIGKVTIASLEAFTENYIDRGKMCPAFDDLGLAQAENQVFGSETVDTLHFDTTIAALLKKNAGRYAACAKVAGSGYNHSTALTDAYADANGKELATRVALLNPMNYIGETGKACSTAPFFRIRVGTKDEHTSFTVAMNLALALETHTDATVDYAMVWGEGHGEADYEGDFVAWIERICKNE